MCVNFCQIVSFELHAVSITRRFQYMPFPVASYPPFPLLAVSSPVVLHAVTRRFRYPRIQRSRTVPPLLGVMQKK